jgi:hypothetical protein
MPGLLCKQCTFHILTFQFFLFQLQELVVEMKDAFTLAMGELSKIQYSDKLLEEKVETNNAENKKQVAEVLQMVLSLKVNTCI